jgi:hypothetical protein
MHREDIFALDCSQRYGTLRPTNSDDVAQMERLTKSGFMSQGSGPVIGDGRCGHYWIITDKGREALGRN